MLYLELSWLLLVLVQQTRHSSGSIAGYGGTVRQAMGKHTQLAGVQLCSLTARQQNNVYFVSLSLVIFLLSTLAIK